MTWARNTPVTVPAQAGVRRRDGDIRSCARHGLHRVQRKHQELLLWSEYRNMCRPGARSCLLYQLWFQGVHQQPEGRLWHFRAGRHSRSLRRVVRAESRDIHVEPPEVGTAARPPTIRPRAQLNEKATFGAQKLSNCKGASMNKAGFATVNPSTGEEIETFSYFTPAQTE